MMQKIREKMLVDLQRITATVNTVEQRRLLMDLDISMRSSGRFHSTLYCTMYIVQCTLYTVQGLHLDKMHIVHNAHIVI